MRVPYVVLLATGGTISSLKDESRQYGYASALSGTNILERVPGYQSVATVDVVDFSRIPSQDMTVDMVLELCRKVAAVLANPDVDGVLVTHGTGTLEDTCFLLDLFLSGGKPVVATGAMYDASRPEWDGRRNILDSLHAIASPEARGKGVLVCMNGELHAARDVTKLHPSSVSAFSSPSLGPLGVVEDRKVVFFRSPLRRYVFSDIRLVQEVAVVKVVQGSDDRPFRAALDLGARGVVIEGFGGTGAIPSWYLLTIGDAQRREVPIVLCARGPVGRVSLADSGSRIALREAGVISGGDLPSHKARLLLMAALAHSTDPGGIRAVFEAITA